MSLDSKQSSLPKSITILGFIANLLLAIGKGFVGYIAQSSALIADAGHSLSDLFSDLITYWSLHFHSNLGMKTILTAMVVSRRLDHSLSH